MDTCRPTRTPPGCSRPPTSTRSMKSSCRRSGSVSGSKTIKSFSLDDDVAKYLEATGNPGGEVNALVGRHRWAAHADRPTARTAVQRDHRGSHLRSAYRRRVAPLLPDPHRRVGSLRTAGDRPRRAVELGQECTDADGESDAVRRGFPAAEASRPSPLDLNLPARRPPQRTKARRLRQRPAAG